jgi:DNA-binding MarR family transcriptional regulator
MSRRARDWAWALPVAPPQKIVILALAERADDGGACCPSLSELTDMTGLARSTVAVALNALEAAELIARERGGATRSTEYRLMMEPSGTIERAPERRPEAVPSPERRPGEHHPLRPDAAACPDTSRGREHVSRWAWACRGLSPAERCVLLALADRADDVGRCRFSLSRLARKSEVDRRTVTRALAVLEDRGLLARNRDRRRGTLYTLAVDAPADVVSPAGGRDPGGWFSP